MHAAKPAAKPETDAEAQLRGFIGKFALKDRARIRAARKVLRQRFPTANELVRDDYNFFVIAYSPTERPSDAFFFARVQDQRMSLRFMHGARLPGPNGVLLGSATQTRFVRLDSPATLQQPDIEALVTAALAEAKVPLPAAGRGKLTIRSVSAKQRPRA